MVDRGDAKEQDKLERSDSRASRIGLKAFYMCQCIKNTHDMSDEAFKVWLPQAAAYN
jgi:hypothetical protein